LEKRGVVEITTFAEKQLKRVPKVIKEAVLIWVETVQEEGIGAVRRLPGYHDEPLRGVRLGQRSIRLNRSFRLFYTETKGGSINVVTVKEINKHDY
jgi:proteic killer suppression protein